MEIWKPVPEADGCEVSTLGNFRRNGVLCQPSPRREYPSFKAGGKHRYLHVMVLETFVGPRPSQKHVAAHNDGNKRNNRVDNLRWATQAENLADRKKHGTESKVGKHGFMPKLTPNEVYQIRKSRFTGPELAKLYGVTSRAIYYIKSKKNWSRLEEKRN